MNHRKHEQQRRHVLNAERWRHRREAEQELERLLIHITTMAGELCIDHDALWLCRHFCFSELVRLRSWCRRNPGHIVPCPTCARMSGGCKQWEPMAGDPRFTKPGESIVTERGGAITIDYGQGAEVVLNLTRVDEDNAANEARR